MSALPLTQVRRRQVNELDALRSDSETASREAGLKLVNEAKSFGLSMRDFLDLSIDVRASNDNGQFEDKDGLLSGYEAALSVLKLPVRDDFSRGITLDLATDTFQTFPGARALFPEVVDDVIQWKYRQMLFENIDQLVGSSRTISGVEMITTVIDDKQEDYENWYQVAELGRVPVKTIRATEKSVKFYKHGGGVRISYEFARRVRLDMLAPYNARRDRETQRSKVAQATSILINGDGVHAAATEVDQSSFNTVAGGASTNGKISFRHLLAWLVSRAQAGAPVDTVVGNWDAYIQWLMMFVIQDGTMGRTDAEKLAASGFQVGGVPLLQGVVNFVLSSTAPANKLIGYSRADTLEELKEAGSLIDESERSVLNQSISYIRTENSGYKLVYGDTRSIFDFGA
jgi:hypothetical protein